MKLFFYIYFLIVPVFVWGQVITTFAGNGIIGFTGEGGPAVNAELGCPAGVGVDKTGNIYLADCNNDVIQKVDTNGILTRFAGNGSSGLAGDGGPATNAELELVQIVGIAVDTANNVYFSDGSRVRMVSQGGIITTVAGSTFGYSGNGGPATDAQLKGPVGICFDRSGDLLVADEEAANIRMVDKYGIISAIAGSSIPGYSGDGGQATAAGLVDPDGIAADGKGNIYFTDSYRVRKIDSTGIVTTIVGNDDFGSIFCNGCMATSIKTRGPFGVAIDRFDNIYVSDGVNDEVYLITQTGYANGIVGNYTAGYWGDGGPPNDAELNIPETICFNSLGDLFIADKMNGRYRKVNYGTASVKQVTKNVAQLIVNPNPVSNGVVSYKVSTDTNEAAEVTVSNMLGQRVYTAHITTNTAQQLLIAIPGIYIVTATTQGQRMETKVVVE
jgi:trimeric autotransporter adhesin